MNNRSCDPFTPSDCRPSNWNEMSRLQKLESTLLTQHVPMGGHIEYHDLYPVAFGDIVYLLSEATKYEKLKKMIKELNCQEYP